MFDAKEAQSMVARLERLTEKKFGVSKGPLLQRMRKVGRRVPKDVHKDVNTVLEAALVAGHPRRSQMLDTAAVRGAFERAETYLNAVDPTDRLKMRLTGILAVIIFNLMVVALLVAAVLKWRGLI